MLDGYGVGTAVGYILVALVLAVGAPYLTGAEYRRVRGHWPQAAWVTRLYLANLECLSLSILVMGISGLLANLGNPPLLGPGDPRWVYVTMLVYSILGLSGLALIGMLALMTAQWRRYGPPRRTPPEMPPA